MFVGNTLTLLLRELLILNVLGNLSLQLHLVWLGVVTDAREELGHCLELLVLLLTVLCQDVKTACQLRHLTCRRRVVP